MKKYRKASFYDLNTIRNTLFLFNPMVYNGLEKSLKCAL